MLSGACSRLLRQRLILHSHGRSGWEWSADSRTDSVKSARSRHLKKKKNQPDSRAIGRSTSYLTSTRLLGWPMDHWQRQVHQTPELRNHIPEEPDRRSTKRGAMYDAHSHARMLAQQLRASKVLREDSDWPQTDCVDEMIHDQSSTCARSHVC